MLVVRDARGEVWNSLQAAADLSAEISKRSAETLNCCGCAPSQAYLPKERHEVVLAERKEFNVFHDYHLIICFLKYGVVYDGGQVLFVALGAEEYGLRITLWSIKQALSVRVLSHALQDCPYSAHSLAKCSPFSLSVVPFL